MVVTDRLTCGIHGRVTGICHLCADERHNRDLTAALAAKERAEAQLASQDDERIALAAKLSELKDAACRFRDLYYATVQERDALANKLAEAEKDAARYRWLREQYEHTRLPLAAVVWKQNNDRQSSEWVNLVNGDALDAAIDAAISQERSDA